MLGSKGNLLAGAAVATAMKRAMEAIMLWACILKGCWRLKAGGLLVK
jgi:Na+-driven multidrug efflux pump